MSEAAQGVSGARSARARLRRQTIRNPEVSIPACDVFVVIAHPDDEVFASGTLCLCAEMGFRIALLCVTDGDGGATLLLHEGQERSRLGEVRRLEVTLSAWALGVADVRFLGYEDIPPSDWDTRSWDCEALTATLAQLIEQARPRLVLTHGPLGGYGHPGHQRVGECVIRAAEQAPCEASVFSFCGQLKAAFFSWRFDEPSQVRVDGRGFTRRRAASLAYHQSELQFFLHPGWPRRLRHFASAMFGFMTPFLEIGRKRTPIGSIERFFKKFPYEGLVLQRAPGAGRPHFFAEHFSHDPRVRLLRSGQDEQQNR